jgi:hypothetical protein
MRKTEVTTMTTKTMKTQQHRLKVCRNINLCTTNLNMGKPLTHLNLVFAGKRPTKLVTLRPEALHLLSASVSFLHPCRRGSKKSNILRRFGCHNLGKPYTQKSNEVSGGSNKSNVFQSLSAHSCALPPAACFSANSTSSNFL